MFPFWMFSHFGALLMVVAIVGIIYWYKARDRELQVHQDMRIREMEHQRKMKELELELEKEKNRKAAEKAEASQLHDPTA